MVKYKQCQFNITKDELDRLNELCERYNYKQAEMICYSVNAYLNNELEEKLYEVLDGNGWSKKIINIEENTYNYFMSEAEFRCRTLVSLIRYSINAMYEKDFVL